LLAPFLGLLLRRHARRDVARLRERLGSGLAIVAGFLAPITDWAEALVWI
jgi:hypothetical protein